MNRIKDNRTLLDSIMTRKGDRIEDIIRAKATSTIVLYGAVTRRRQKRKRNRRIKLMYDVKNEGYKRTKERPGTDHNDNETYRSVNRRATI